MRPNHWHRNEDGQRRSGNDRKLRLGRIDHPEWHQLDGRFPVVPSVVSDLDPVSLSVDAGLSKQLAVSSLLNEPLATQIAFAFVPDAGVCHGILEGETASHGRNFLLFCEASDAGGYLLSLSANQAGTVITSQSIRNDQGQITHRLTSLQLSIRLRLLHRLRVPVDRRRADDRLELRRCGYAWPE